MNMTKLKKMLSLNIFFGIIILVIYIIVLTPLTAHAAEYTLLDIYKIALTQSEKIKMAEEDLYLSHETQDKTLGGLLPNITAFGSYKTYGTKSYGLKASKNLSLGGSEIIAYKMSKVNINKSEYDLKTVKSDYLLDVTTAYINILRASKAVTITQTNVTRLKNHRDAALIRLQVGETIKTAVLRAEAELSGANVELVKAQNGLNLAKAVLARLIGLTDEYQIIETSDIFELDDSKTLYELKDMAVKNRMEVKSLELADKILEQNINIAKGSFWPVISAEIVYSNTFLEPSPQYFPSEGLYTGVTLSYALFEGGIRRIEVNEAKSKWRKASLSLIDLKKSLQIGIENLYSEYQTQMEVLKSIADQLAFSQDNYNLVSKQYSYGLVNSLDVMDANNILSRAETSLSDARYNYQLIVIKLKHATGMLLPEIEGKN